MELNNYNTNYELPNINIVKSFMKTDVKCTNCGQVGHQYKNCNEPIISYGIICFNKKNNKFLLIQRKHTIAYVDFIRGKYSLNDINFIYMLFENMSQNEKKDLLKYDFTELWKKLWINSKKTVYRDNEFKKARELFNIITDGISINNKDYTLKSIIAETNIKLDIDWEFPKGRRNIGEADLECAIREFREETNMVCDKDIIGNEKYIEEFIGSNNISYKYIYYLYNVDTDFVPFVDEKNMDQITEIGNVGWFNYDECMEKIKCRRKMGILRKIKNKF